MYTPHQKIGILGSGEVGQVLGGAFLSEGHEVMLGTRDKTKDSVVQWQKENPSARTGTFAETADFGDILVLAVQGSSAEEVLKQTGFTPLRGKTILDATNPIAQATPVNGVLKYFTSLDESLMERLQQLVPTAKFVKAFNSTGNAYFYKPDFQGVKPTMFICGNDEDAKQTAMAILDAFGWEAADMGNVEAARAIEPLCMLWCIPGLRNNQWTHAFKLLKS
jgi:predicted dinucleotide-binding enzyme